MDYCVLLKNVNLNDKYRVEIESKLFDIDSLSNGFEKTILYINKYDEIYDICFELVRQDYSIKSVNIFGKDFFDSIEKAKENILETILKDFVLSAS